MVRVLNMKDYYGMPVRQSLTFIVTYDSFLLSSDAYISLCSTCFSRRICCMRDAIRLHIFSIIIVKIHFCYRIIL